MNNRQRAKERVQMRTKRAMQARYEYIKAAKKFVCRMADENRMKDIFFFATLPKEEFKIVAKKNKVPVDYVHATKVVCQNSILNWYSVQLPKTVDCLECWNEVDEAYMVAYDSYEDEYLTLKTWEDYNSYYGL